MRVKLVLLLVFLSFSVRAFAGKIYGSISEGGKPVAQGVKLDVTCGTNTYSAQTDQHGSFNLFAKDSGKCKLTVFYQNQMPSMDINSFDGSVQYDLILEKQGTQYTLKRK